MACNLSDPQISEAYTRIVNGDGINWMVIGYGKTRDTLSLYATGNGGITEMALNVPDEVVFAFLIFEGSNVLVTHVSEKISGVQRARGLAHQKTVASYFEQHDITVNASKPSELTPAMLRDKTRHLAIKTLSIKGVGAADRSIPKSPNRLRSPIWRTSSQFGSPTTDAAPTSPSARSAKPSTAGSAADAASPVASEPTHSSKEASAVEEDAADPKDNSPRQLHADIEPLNGSFASTADVKKDDTQLSAAARRAKMADSNILINGPPTPKSFSETTRLPRIDGAASDDYSKPISRGSVASSFSIQSHLDSASSVSIQSIQSDLLPSEADSPNVPDGKAGSPNGNSQSSFDSGRNSTTAASAATISTGRYSTGRASDKLSKPSLNRKPRGSIHAVASPSDLPEVRHMLDRVNTHRRKAASLAETSGLLGTTYFECLRGYTTIQQPTGAFWKRRYFVIANSTLFMFTNECSRTPSDYLPLTGVLAPPRDAEEEVLMPHSVALRFEAGEYLMYFDSDEVRQAFEAEIRKAISSSLE